MFENTLPMHDFCGMIGGLDDRHVQTHMNRGCDLTGP